MKADTIFKTAYILSAILLTAGLLFKIRHWPNGSNIISAGLLFSIIYIFIGIQSVLAKPNIELTEKILWVAGFTFFGTITGIVYMVIKPEQREFTK